LTHFVSFTSAQHWREDHCLEADDEVKDGQLEKAGNQGKMQERLGKAHLTKADPPGASLPH
jgi:hypothetical protein